jgi:hypothetical protein
LKALAAWSLCWAAAIVFSITAAPEWFSLLVSQPASLSVIHVALPALAFLVALRAPAPWLLGLLAAAQLAHVADGLPEVPNHRLILGFGDLAVLAALLQRRRAPDVLDALLPAVRAIVVSLYAFAFFAKLNTDFLDPSSSCAAQFYGNVISWWPMLPDGPRIRAGAVVATLVVEGTLAVALCVPRARPAAVLAGLGFHFLLALDATKVFLNFSAVMFAGLLSFLPRAFWDALGGSLERRPGLRAALGAGLIAIVASGLFAAADWPARNQVYVWMRQAVWSAYALALVGYVLWWWTSAHQTERPLPWPSPAAMAAIGLAWLNGLSPYLGLKTRTTFDMYSNLRLEADHSNHLVVPRSLDVFGFLHDRVSVLETNDPALRRAYVETGDELPYFELRSYLTQHPQTRVRYVRAGNERREVGTREPVTPVMRKLVIFRPLGERSRRECVW